VEPPPQPRPSGRRGRAPSANPGSRPKIRRFLFGKTPVAADLAYPNPTTTTAGLSLHHSRPTSPAGGLRFGRPPMRELSVTVSKREESSIGNVHNFQFWWEPRYPPRLILTVRSGFDGAHNPVTRPPRPCPRTL
jgi:hypothetical protein